MMTKEELIKRIESLKIEHRACGDYYHSCPMAEDVPDGWGRDECDCGALEHNAEVDSIISDLEAGNKPAIAPQR